MNKATAKEIREHWFKDHIATLTQHGKLQVLDWSRPNSGMYRCRYVFDGCMMYISGDIGNAVFWLTWKADVHSFDDIGIDYFMSKLTAYQDDKKEFSSSKAVKRLREWLKDIKENCRVYDHDDMKELFEKARECSSRDEWAFIINERTDFIEKLDRDYWEWFYSIGDEIPARVYGYLVGLQMASKQLRKAEQQAV